MTMDVPRVSVVIPAYNLARFLPAAIDSALTQQYPEGAIEVIVVDDGSTDATAAVLETYGPAITTISQPNAGLVGAVDAGLAAATGTYIGLLDADDEWPADRLARQVAHLEAHPRVGLVHGDMELIDADGITIGASFEATQREAPTSGRILGRLLAGNFVSGGASLFRAALLPAITPIPADAAYPDWWIAATVAAVAEIDHLPGTFNRYRSHGANMGLGAGPERLGAILRAEIPFRRWMLTHLLADSSIEPADLVRAWRSHEHGLARAAADEATGARPLVSITAEQRAGARALAGAGAALRAVDPMTSARLLLQALAQDPWDGAARLDLELALGALTAGAVGSESRAGGRAEPLCGLPVRATVTLAWASELERDPSLLVAYGDAVTNADDATLLILTDETTSLDGLVGLVERAGLAGEGAADLLAQPEAVTTPARGLLAARATAVLAATPPPAYAGLPRHRALHGAGTA